MQYTAARMDCAVCPEDGWWFDSLTYSTPLPSRSFPPTYSTRTPHLLSTNIQQMRSQC